MTKNPRKKEDIEAYRYETDKRKNAVPETPKSSEEKRDRIKDGADLLVLETQIRTMKIWQWHVKPQDLEEFIKSRSNL